MSVRQAVLLVGGRGTRLWPLTDTQPKALVPVAGIPFVEYQFRRLAAAGIEEAWLAVGSGQAAAWEEYLAGRRGPIDVRLSAEEEPLDTAGPVTLLGGRLDDRFLVLNGDVVIDAPIGDFMAAAPAAGIVLTLVPVADPSKYGVVVTDSDGTVTRFVEKPAPGTAPSHNVNAGMYLVERRVLERFEPGPLSFERRVFPDLAAEKELAAVVIGGGWIDIGTPELYLDTHESVLTGRTGLRAGRDPHGSGPGVIDDGERRGSWSWVDEGATISAGAVIKESVVLGGARIGPGAEVERAVVGWDSELGAGTTVRGETVIGAGCRIGPECELGAGMRVAAGTELERRAISFSPPQ